MTLSLMIGGKWTAIPRVYSRGDAMALLRAAKVPARMIDETGKVIACRVI